MTELEKAGFECDDWERFDASVADYESIWCEGTGVSATVRKEEATAKESGDFLDKKRADRNPPEDGGERPIIVVGNWVLNDGYGKYEGTVDRLAEYFGVEVRGLFKDGQRGSGPSREEQQLLEEEIEAKS